MAEIENVTVGSGAAAPTSAQPGCSPKHRVKPLPSAL